MTRPDCTKMAISQLLVSVASSNLVGRMSKSYFIIKFSLLLCIRLCWRETSQRIGFGQNSCVADEQACVLGSCAFNKHSVLKIFMINGLNFQTV